MERYSYYPTDPGGYGSDEDTWEDRRGGSSLRGYSSMRPSSRPPLPPGGWDDSGRSLTPGNAGGRWDQYGGDSPPPPPPGRAPRNPAPRRHSHLAREIIETIVLTALIFFAIRFSVQTFRVDGPSMQPGLFTGEYVLVNKLAYLFHGPQRGDVIVFHYPRDPTQDFIKRVIGLPGDTLVITNDAVKVDGVTLKEPYISQAANAQIINLKLQPDQYFVMGDNRPFSSDSRAWGPVPASYIIGKATLVFWPLSNWEVIPTFNNVFASLPTS